jgi:mevalonate kinase
VLLVAPDLNTQVWLSKAVDDDPLAVPLWLVRALAGGAPGGFRLTVRSDIPIASGLGSGAAIAIAVIRAAGLQWGLQDRLTPAVVSALAFEVERLHHGTPSGIDNTVIAYEQPVYFIRRQPENQIERFSPARPLRLLVGDTGIRSSTREVVGDVRRQWEADPARFESLFDGCGRVAEAARSAVARADNALVGRLMDENQALLEEMTVSSTDLGRLVGAARAAGALGAKLSGGGRGGNMIALVTEESEEPVRRALLAAGAARVLLSVIG